MKKIAQVRESHGSSFSANLRCFNFEFTGGACSHTPKDFRTCSKNLHWVREKSVKSHGKVMEKSGNSLENFLYATLEGIKCIFMSMKCKTLKIFRAFHQVE